MKKMIFPLLIMKWTRVLVHCLVVVVPPEGESTRARRIGVIFYTPTSDICFSSQGVHPQFNFLNLLTTFELNGLNRIKRRSV